MNIIVSSFLLIMSTILITSNIHNITAFAQNYDFNTYDNTFYHTIYGKYLKVEYPTNWSYIEDDNSWVYDVQFFPQGNITDPVKESPSLFWYMKKTKQLDNLPKNPSLEMLSKYFDENMMFRNIEPTMIKHENIDLILSDRTFKAIKETVDFDQMNSKFIAYLFVDNVDPVIILTKAPLSDYEKYKPILDRMLMSMKIYPEKW